MKTCVKPRTERSQHVAELSRRHSHALTVVTTDMMALHEHVRHCPLTRSHGELQLNIWAIVALVELNKAVVNPEAVE